MAPKNTFTYTIKNVTFAAAVVNGKTCWNTTSDLASGEEIIQVFGHPQCSNSTAPATILCLTCVTT